MLIDLGCLLDDGVPNTHGTAARGREELGLGPSRLLYILTWVDLQVMAVYQPGAIVVCGGADSLSGDRLGCFNLSLQGHAHCMQFMAQFNVPMLVLGGGGYTMRNVARCWCYETGRLLGQELPDECAWLPVWACIHHHDLVGYASAWSGLWM